jgi:hypothetical protein
MVAVEQFWQDRSDIMNRRFGKDVLCEECHVEGAFGSPPGGAAFPARRAIPAQPKFLARPARREGEAR